MTKAAPLTFLLLLVCANYAAAQEGPTEAPAEAPSEEDSLDSPPVQAIPPGGLDEKCKKSANPAFCGLVFQPHAAIFSSNDPQKIGFTAINVTLAQVRSTKSFMTREAMNDKSSKVHAAMMTCVGRVARAEGSLKMAAREFNFTSETEVQRKIHRTDPKKMLDSATAELTTCLDALKKNTAADEGSNDVALVAMRKTDESVIACSVAKSLLQ